MTGVQQSARRDRNLSCFNSLLSVTIVISQIDSLPWAPIIRLILAGTVVRVRLDRKATSIVLLVVLGVRYDGHKVLLAAKNMGGETSAAWRAVLDALVKRGLRKPEFLIVHGGTGLEQALAALWGDVPTQRCTVHKHRRLGDWHRRRPQCAIGRHCYRWKRMAALASRAVSGIGYQASDFFTTSLIWVQFRSSNATGQNGSPTAGKLGEIRYV
jgi:hypothetical protein